MTNNSVNEKELREAVETYIHLGRELTQEQHEAVNTMRRLCRQFLDTVRTNRLKDLTRKDSLND